MGLKAESGPVEDQQAGRLTKASDLHLDPFRQLKEA